MVLKCKECKKVSTYCKECKKIYEDWKCSLEYDEITKDKFIIFTC